MDPAFGILLAAFLVFLNGFFVAAEFALVKVRRTQLQENLKEGTKGAALALHATHHLDAYLSATQLGITLASIGLGWVGEPTVARLLDPVFGAIGLAEQYRHGAAFAVAFTVISVFHIVLGELAPKSWAIQKPERMVSLVVYPLHWFYLVFKPAIWVLNGLAGALLRIFGLHTASDHETAHSEEEILMLVKASGQSGVLNPTEVLLAGKVLNFADKAAYDIMIPRVEVAVLDVSQTLEQTLEAIRAQPYSRYPVVDGDRDSVVGVVHVRDLLALKPGESLSSVVRSAHFVPESRSLDLLLRDFQQWHQHMAVVLDEHGGTAGIVTLEDVIEQIVGEISDEYDVKPPQIEQVADNEWRVQGQARIRQIADELEVEISDEKHDTVAALVSDALKHKPRRGDCLKLGNVEFEVSEIAHGRPSTLIVRLLSQPLTLLNP
ncbi:MAG: hypothetical protein BGO01_07440 [Armatimonadetes bacterium 55-13]|nr:HlyC/CorC family transporter [Armatimonadota bacterium]OJU63698.1 MAG: hypothetical protein BGO01_07440 [Armatimonadetes bacterium 55-13]